MEEFGILLNLPHEDRIIELRDKANIYDYIIVASSLMKEPSSHIPYPFTVGYIHCEIRMTHDVMNHILFPRKGNLSLFTQVDVETIWFIENKVKVNWAHQVIEYMLERKNKRDTPSIWKSSHRNTGRNMIQL